MGFTLESNQGAVNSAQGSAAGNPSVIPSSEVDLVQAN